MIKTYTLGFCVSVINLYRHEKLNAEMKLILKLEFRFQNSEVRAVW